MYSTSLFSDKLSSVKNFDLSKDKAIDPRNTADGVSIYFYASYLCEHESMICNRRKAFEREVGKVDESKSTGGRVQITFPVLSYPQSPVFLRWLPQLQRYLSQNPSPPELVRSIASIAIERRSLTSSTKVYYILLHKYYFHYALGK